MLIDNMSFDVVAILSRNIIFSSIPSRSSNLQKALFKTDIFDMASLRFKSMRMRCNFVLGSLGEEFRNLIP